jgi:hypothetical protein
VYVTHNRNGFGILGQGMSFRLCAMYEHLQSSFRPFARSVLLSFTALRSTPALLQGPTRPRDGIEFGARPGRPFRAASVPLRYVVLRRTHRARNVRMSLPVLLCAARPFPSTPPRTRRTHHTGRTITDRNWPSPNGDVADIVRTVSAFCVAHTSSLVAVVMNCHHEYDCDPHPETWEPTVGHLLHRPRICPSPGRSATHGH